MAETGYRAPIIWKGPLSEGTHTLVSAPISRSKSGEAIPSRPALKYVPGLSIGGTWKPVRGTEPAFGDSWGGRETSPFSTAYPYRRETNSGEDKNTFLMDALITTQNFAHDLSEIVFSARRASSVYA